MRTDLNMRRINNLMDDFFVGRAIPAFNTVCGQLYLACSIEDADKNFIVTVELPGIDKNRVAVEIDNKKVSINVKEGDQVSNKKYLLNEIVTGKAQRTFEFSELLDSDNASVDYKNGVLILTIPKKERSNKKVLTFND